MIIEAFQYLTTPASVTARKMGYVQEIIAIKARYNRSKKQWSNHLNQTKRFIKTSGKNVSNQKEVIILGSGLLLDIPIEYLSQHFRHVYLLDIAHLNATKRKIKPFDNITLVEHDITGFADKLLSYDFKESAFPKVPVATIPCLTKKTGLVISANLLSQIHLAPVCYAEKKLSLNKQKIETFTNEIFTAHLSMLCKLKCNVCLITDNQRFYRDRNQTIVNAEKVLPGINLPEPDDSWYWEIAPFGEIENLSMASHVYAYIDFNRFTQSPPA